MPTLRFTCKLPTGLHARPASLIAETVRRHHSAAVVTNEHSGASTEGRSVLSLIGLDIQHGHSVLIEAHGDDAAELLEALDALVENNFGESLTPAEPTGKAAAFVSRVPAPLRRMNVPVVKGRAVCAGVGEGVAVIAGGLRISEVARHSSHGAAETEWKRVESALAAVHEEIDLDLHNTRDALRSELLRAHLGIVEDPALRDRLHETIRSGQSAACAIVDASGYFSARLGASLSAYIRERAADIEDICRRLLGKIDPALLGESAIALDGPSVVVADSLGVSQLMAMDIKHLRGLVLGDVGSTSHLVILARSMQVPTIIGVEGPTRAIGAGKRIVVDAIGGFAVTDATPEVLAYYARDRQARAKRHSRLEPLLRKAGATKDGQPLEVAANAAMPVEIRAAMAAGADSIGLLRTEMLFLDRADAPSEEEQFTVYREAVEAAGADREVIIRTLDIGGDKPAPYIHVPEEDNPFLGCRGVRLYHNYPDLLRAQLRAACRASAHGSVKLMAPMVATVGEAKWFCDQVAKAQSELGVEGIAHDPNMDVGIMVEVPSVATIIDQLAHVVDFISIGTNDLCQYWTAADRTNPAVAALNNVREPSFLRLLDQIVSKARDHGLWAGMCGEMAGDPQNLPLLVGLGLSEVSAAAPAIAPIKTMLAGLDTAACRSVLERAMACETAGDVTKVLEEFAAARAGSDGTSGCPVHPDLVLIGCAATTREQVIQELVGVLHAAGRTDDPRALEEAVWVREDKGPTGLGFGFAIPHGQTDAVSCPSIAVANLRAPIEWASADGQPVRGVIMLAVPASDADKTHLRLLAKLARRLMHVGFRESLLAATDVETVVRILETELELKRA